MDLFKNIPTHMDFDGQRKAEKIFQTIILVFAFGGLAWGYAWEMFSVTVLTLTVGFLLASVITLPPWPMYRRKPLKWQKPRENVDDVSVSTAAKGKKKK